MADHHRNAEPPHGDSHSSDPSMPDHDRSPRDADRRRPSPPSDAGRTSGGGSLGHVQPENVQREAPLRNNAATRESDEPTLPSDDATLDTKI